jgi:hypothetical protein
VNFSQLRARIGTIENYRPYKNYFIVYFDAALGSPGASSLLGQNPTG